MDDKRSYEMEKIWKKKKEVPFLPLFSFADSRDKLLMIIATIASIANGLSQPIMTLIIGDVIDILATSQITQIASLESKISLRYVYLALGSGAAAFLQVYCWMMSGVRQTARMRSVYLKCILGQDIDYFDQEVCSGEVIGRMSDDTILIQDAIGDKVGKFLQVAASFIGGFVVAFSKGWLLTLVLSTSILLVVVSAAFMFFISFRMSSRAQRAYTDAASIVQQTISSIRTVASFTGEKQAVANYSRLLTTVYKSDMIVGLSTGLGNGFLMFTTSCTFALAVWFGAKMILHKGYTGGDVFTVLLAVLIGSFSLGQASPSMTAISAGHAAAVKMFETINRKPTIDAYDPKGKILNDISGEIEFKDVCFSYPARPKERIFQGFSLLIPNGTTAALVGQSGSGKSTVISLIERFYDPVSGAVLIDGVDLREFQLKWIRSKIGLVSQEPVLFSTSIKNNIAYGKDGATLDEITSAAELANAIDFIHKLPMGLDTMVGEHGIQLSGGQKQRVAIARAILKDPRILLLDEATSALDSDSERIVQEALEKIMVDRTSVIVAHRLSTIRNANMIAVLHQGKLVEIGTHLELLKDTQGVYSNLVHSQDLINEEDKEEYISTSMRSLSSVSSGVGSISFSKAAIEHENTFSVSPDNVSILRLARLNKPEALVLVLGAIFGTIRGAMMPIYGLMVSFIIETFYEFPYNLKKDSELWALRFVILGVVSLVVIPFSTYLFSVAGSKLIQRIRVMCFEKVVNMEVGWFDMGENSSGEIGARLSTDAAKIRSLVGDALGLLVQEMASVCVALVIAIEASWQLAFITLALMPLIGINVYLQSKSHKGDGKLMYDEASEIGKDAVSNIRTVGSFCAQEKVIEMYNQKCEGPTKLNAMITQGFSTALGFGLSTCSVYLVYAATFYAGARLIEDGTTSFPHVLRVFFALSMVTHALSVVRALAPDSRKAKSSAASVFAALDRKSSIDPSDHSGTTLVNVNGDIRFRHVTFSYPARPGVRVLRNLSLTINSGKIVALVGESGSGKSTVISLLQRFYDPDSGCITLDGTDVNKFRVKWLRQQMGLVSQEPVLFNDTIRANIAFGKGGTATEAEIIAAAKSASADEFISGLQQGYNTVVGERGVQLSGGQKQRVAIARAIVKRPKILLLDEATSALDAESEKIVQEALERVMVGRTTVVVAHRLSTIRGADEIAVFRNGKIVEKGNHNTLINIKDGFYSTLVALQTTAHS